MTFQEKLSELKKNIVSQFNAMIQSKGILKDFRRYDKALDEYADLKCHIKQKKIDPESDYTSDQQTGK